MREKGNTTTYLRTIHAQGAPILLHFSRRPPPTSIPAITLSIAHPRQPYSYNPPAPVTCPQLLPCTAHFLRQFLFFIANIPISAGIPPANPRDFQGKSAMYTWYYWYTDLVLSCIIALGWIPYNSFNSFCCYFGCSPEMPRVQGNPPDPHCPAKNNLLQSVKKYLHTFVEVKLCPGRRHDAQIHFSCGGNSPSSYATSALRSADTGPRR